MGRKMTRGVGSFRLGAILLNAGFDELHPALNEQRVIMPTVAEIDGRGVAGKLGTGVGDVLLVTLPARLGSGETKE